MEGITGCFAMAADMHAACFEQSVDPIDIPQISAYTASTATSKLSDAEAYSRVPPEYNVSVGTETVDDVSTQV